MVEADISQSYAVVATMSFFVISVIMLSFAAPWQDVLAESGRLEVSSNIIATPAEKKA